METPQRIDESQEPRPVINEIVLNALADRLQRHFNLRVQALNAAEAMIVHRMRVDWLPTLAQVQTMKTFDLIEVLRFCPESDFYYHEHDSIFEAYENRT